MPEATPSAQSGAIERRAESADAPAAGEMTGLRKAAIVMLALGEKGAPIWGLLEERDIDALSAAMAGLGSLPNAVTEPVLDEFADLLEEGGGVDGDPDSVGKLLANVLSSLRAETVMRRIVGPPGRTLWEKLGNLGAAKLARYLSGERPQTVAVILAQMSPAAAAAVLSLLPRPLASEALLRLPSMKPVEAGVLQRLADSLRVDLIGGGAKEPDDRIGMAARIVDGLDRNVEESVMSAVEDADPELAERIRALIFTYEDIFDLSDEAMQKVVRGVAKEDLTVALKGTPESGREKFYRNMSERVAKLIADDIEALGAVRLHAVEAAQGKIARAAKKLNDAGEIVIDKFETDDA